MVVLAIAVTSAADGMGNSAVVSYFVGASRLVSDGEVLRILRPDGSEMGSRNMAFVREIDARGVQA